MILRGQVVSVEKTLDCAVLDVSCTGARLRLLGAREFPETALLRLPDGAVRAGRLRWQQNSEAGFEFLNETAT